MQFETEHRFVIELLEVDGEVPPCPIPKDAFLPAAEWATLQAIRRGRLDSSGAPLRARLDPIFSEEPGPPRLAAIRLSLFDARDEPCWVEDLRAADFAERARAGLAQWRERAGRTRGDVAIRYVLSAYPSPPEARASRAVVAREIANPLPIVAGSREALQRRVRPSSEEPEPSESELPIFISEAVIAEARVQAEEAGDVETGGVLLGRLLRDAHDQDVLLEVTCQIPARQAIAEPMRLTFTAETWGAIEDAMALRRRPDELMVGWWHSHPARAWCRQCTAESRALCAYTRPFLSDHDRTLHSSVFPKAYSLALVLVDRAEGESFSFEPAVFGWCREGLRERGFHVLTEPAPWRPTELGNRYREVPR